MSHVQSLEKDFYLDIPGSFDHVFTQLYNNVIMHDLKNIYVHIFCNKKLDHHVKRWSNGKNIGMLWPKR
jgi:hypothetical protein